MLNKDKISKLFWHGLSIDVIARKLHNERCKAGDKISRNETRAIVERVIFDDLKKISN